MNNQTWHQRFVKIWRSEVNRFNVISGDKYRINAADFPMQLMAS
jgi:hypothetical protein